MDKSWWYSIKQNINALYKIGTNEFRSLLNISNTLNNWDIEVYWTKWFESLYNVLNKQWIIHKCEIFQNYSLK